MEFKHLLIASHEKGSSLSVADLAEFCKKATESEHTALPEIELGNGNHIRQISVQIWPLEAF